MREQLQIPRRLAATCSESPERQEWLARLPAAVMALQQRWSLELAAPFDSDEVSCAWVAPAALPNSTSAILKLGMPHMEAEDEIAGLRFWDGEPTVQLLAADESLNAMLLERCMPGTALRQLPEPEQDVIIAAMLRRLWRTPPAGSFRPLTLMLDGWAAATRARRTTWPDAGLVEAGLQLFTELPRSATYEVLLATDLHAGNVLRAEREPWLVIDPKPFLGDPAFDATQHLLNCTDRLRSAPQATIEHFAELLELDAQRVQHWIFARAAVEWEDWDDATMSLARQLA